MQENLFDGKCLQGYTMDMRNLKLEISYDGSRYYGWERQPDKPTIQGKLEEVLTRMCESPVEVIGAGRTDAGVHAKAMIANAHLSSLLPAEEIRDYMNRYLPDDISVNEVRDASERFHARYNAVGKTYQYVFYCGRRKPVFRRKYVTVLERVPDVKAMEEAAKHLVGTHDYRAFSSNPNMKKSTVRTVDSIRIHLKSDFLYIDFHGNGFLQNMVRIMTGTLLEVGQGIKTPDDVKTILEGKDRRNAGPTAPAKGLTLIEVDY